MQIQVEFWHLLSLLLSFIGVLATFGMVLLKQIDARIDHQNDRMSKLEGALNGMMVSLPLEYQRREDAIRFETTLNAKLDAIYGAVYKVFDEKGKI